MNGDTAQSTIAQLLINASTRNEKVSKSAMDALVDLVKLHGKTVFEAVRSTIFQATGVLPENLISVCLQLFSLAHNSCDKEDSVSLFLSLQKLLTTTKKVELLDLWNSTCKEFVSSQEIAEAVCQSEIDCSAVMVTLCYVAKFAPDFLASTYENVGPNPMTVNPKLFTRVVSDVAKNATKSSPFFSTCFAMIFNWFVEQPSTETVEALSLIYNRILPGPCPVRSSFFVTKLCEIGPSSDIVTITALLEILATLVFDVETMRIAIEFLLNLMQSVYVQETIKVEKGAGFPVDAMEMPPSCSSPMFLVCLSTIVKLCRRMPEMVLTVILSSFDHVQRSVGYMAVSHLLRQTTLTKDQCMMVLYSVTATISKRFYDLALSQLCLEILQSLPISEREAVTLVSYITEGSIAIHNAHYLMQVVSVDQAHLSTVFNLLAGFLFDESKVPLIPAVAQALHLLSIRMAGDNGVFIVRESASASTDGDESHESSAGEQKVHPLVAILLKRSISEKSLYLLRILSSLMCIGALHPFVPAMLSNLSVFFECVFPIAFDEIKAILDSATRCINSGSEFPSLVMSLLSNIMKLLNDRQFHLALCSGIVHEVEQNSYVKHTRNCLEIFGAIEPFLPTDVSSANLTKIFQSVSFADANVVETLAKLLGTISGNNYALVAPILQKWVQMKTNTSMIVGREKIPIPYQFICTSLAHIARDVSLDMLITQANNVFLRILASLMKRKEVPPYSILTTLNEFSMRLGFQRLENGKFLMKEFDYFVKYVVQIMTLSTQPQIQKKALSALRLLIQVPPCLVHKDFGVVTEKVLSPEFLQAGLADQQMFSELRSFILALVCVLPESEVLSVFLKTLVPFGENIEVLSLIWRLLSMFQSYSQDESNVIKFFRPVKHGKLDAVIPLLTDLLAASYSDCSEAKYAITSVSLILQIDRKVTPNEQDMKSIFEMLNETELTDMIRYTLGSFRRCSPYFYPNYTHVLAELWKFKSNALTADQIRLLSCDILTQKITSSPDLLQKLLLADSSAFLNSLLNIGITEKSFDVLSKCFTDTECVEHVTQQASLLLLGLPCERNVSQILFLCNQMVKVCEIPRVHLFQMVCSLIIFGIAAREFERVSGLLVSEIHKIVGKRQTPAYPKLALDKGRFKQTWESVIQTVLPEKANEITATVSSVSMVICGLIELDGTLLVDVMNSIMSTVNLTNHVVASSVCLFAGEVIMQMKEYSASSHFFNLFFSALLSFGQLFDEFTCLCCLSGLTKLMRKEGVCAETFPSQYTSRILQVMLKRCTSESNCVMDSIIVCLGQFCKTFCDGIDEKLNEFIFAIVMELLRQTQVEMDVTLVNVLESLLNNEKVRKFDKKYEILKQILEPKKENEGNSIEADKENEKEYCVVLNLLIESNIPWLVCRAISFLTSSAGFLMPMFGTRILELIKSTDDEITETAQRAVVLVLRDTE